MVDPAAPWIVLAILIAVVAVVLAAIVLSSKEDPTTTSSLTVDQALVASSIQATDDLRTGTLTAYEGANLQGETKVDVLNVGESLNVQGSFAVDKLTVTQKVVAPKLETGTSLAVEISPAISTGNVNSTGTLTAPAAVVTTLNATTGTFTGALVSASLATGAVHATQSSQFDADVKIAGGAQVGGLTKTDALEVTNASTFNGPVNINSLDLETLRVRNGVLFDQKGSFQCDRPATFSQPTTFQDDATMNSVTANNLTVANTLSAGAATFASITATNTLTTGQVNAINGAFGAGAPNALTLTNAGHMSNDKSLTVGAGLAPNTTALDVKQDAKIAGGLNVSGPSTLAAVSASSVTATGTVQGANVTATSAMQCATFQSTGNAQVGGTVQAAAANVLGPVTGTGVAVFGAGVASGVVLTAEKDALVKGKATIGSALLTEAAAIDTSATALLKGPLAAWRPRSPYSIRTICAVSVRYGVGFLGGSDAVYYVGLTDLVNSKTRYPNMPSTGLNVAGGGYYLENNMPITGLFSVNGVFRIRPGTGDYAGVKEPIQLSSDNITPSGNVYSPFMMQSVSEDNQTVKFQGIIRWAAGQTLTPWMRINGDPPSPVFDFGELNAYFLYEVDP
jgi:hypothetical protein